VTFSAFQSESK